MRSSAKPDSKTGTEVSQRLRKISQTKTAAAKTHPELTAVAYEYIANSFR